MHRILLVCAATMVSVQALVGQIRLQENFEGPDTIPPGWSVHNLAPFPIDPEAQWTVRDTGLALPGLSTARSVAHNSARAVGVSWWTSIDTVSGAIGVADAWLVTPRVPNIQAGDVLRFWATGGTQSYLDSLQIHISEDSIPVPFLTLHLGTIVWPVGSTYGQFSQYTFSLDDAIGFDIFIGFRFLGDCSVDGFFVHVDDVSVEGATSVDQVAEGRPSRFMLGQNHPNPFNPSTTIPFSLPHQTHVSLKIYNILGEEVAALVDEVRAPGSHVATWAPQGIASGTYVYRLLANDAVESRKLLLLR